MHHARGPPASCIWPSFLIEPNDPTLALDRLDQWHGPNRSIDRPISIEAARLQQVNRSRSQDVHARLRLPETADGSRRSGLASQFESSTSAIEKHQKRPLAKQGKEELGVLGCMQQAHAPAPALAGDLLPPIPSTCQGYHCPTPSRWALETDVTRLGRGEHASRPMESRSKQSAWQRRCPSWQSRPISSGTRAGPPKIP